MTLPDFLTFAAGPGVNAVVGFILSFVAEWVPGWNDLAPKTKRLAMMAGSFVVPVVATLLLGKYDQAAVWNALIAGFTAFYDSQAAALRKL